MPGILPDIFNGGLVYRSGDGECLPAPVSGAYCPGPNFSMSCEATALPSNCTARLSPEQVNSLVSEMLGLAEAFDPSGAWDCNSVGNLAQLFQNWVQSFQAGEFVGITDVDVSTVEVVNGVDVTLTFTFNNGSEEQVTFLVPAGNDIVGITSSSTPLVPMGNRVTLTFAMSQGAPLTTTFDLAESTWSTRISESEWIPATSTLRLMATTLRNGVPWAADSKDIVLTTPSDYRLKTLRDPEGSSWETVKQLGDAQSFYSYNTSLDVVELGWMAHDLQAVFPSAVTGVKDEQGEDGSPVYQGRNDVKLIPVLVSALSEALRRIEELESRLGA